MDNRRGSGGSRAPHLLNDDEGFGPYQIAQALSADKIEIPSAHLARHNEGVNKTKTFKDIYGWGSSTIVNILEKREYLGHTSTSRPASM